MEHANLGDMLNTAIVKYEFFKAVQWPVDEQEAIRVAKREECRIWLIQQELLAS